MQTVITWKTKQGLSYELRTNPYPEIGEIQFDLHTIDITSDGQRGYWSVANLTREAAVELRDRLNWFLETGT